MPRHFFVKRADCLSEAAGDRRQRREIPRRNVEWIRKQRRQVRRQVAALRVQEAEATRTDENPFARIDVFAAQLQIVSTVGDKREREIVSNGYGPLADVLGRIRVRLAGGKTAQRDVRSALETKTRQLRLVPRDERALPPVEARIATLDLVDHVRSENVRQREIEIVAVASPLDRGRGHNVRATTPAWLTRRNVVIARPANIEMGLRRELKVDAGAAFVILGIAGHRDIELGVRCRPVKRLRLPLELVIREEMDAIALDRTAIGAADLLIRVRQHLFLNEVSGV